MVPMHVGSQAFLWEDVKICFRYSSPGPKADCQKKFNEERGENIDPLGTNS